MQQHTVLFLHGAGGVKENTWDEKEDEVAEAKMAWMDANKTIAETGTGSDIADAAGIKYEEAHEAEEDAHLSYLTWTTAGKNDSCYVHNLRNVL